MDEVQAAEAEVKVDVRRLSVVTLLSYSKDAHRMQTRLEWYNMLEVFAIISTSRHEQPSLADGVLHNSCAV